MKPKTNRTRLIGIIHAQRTAADLDEVAYRAVIGGATGNETCAACTMTQLKSVFYALNTVLTRQGKKPFVFIPRYEAPSLLDAVLARAEKILGTDYQVRLDLFIQTKVRKASLSCLTQRELRQVMGFLSNVERRERNAAK